MHGLEILRRSAAMAPLPHADIDEVISQCIQLQRERTEMARILAELPSSWTAVRTALNDLHRLVE